MKKAPRYILTAVVVLLMLAIVGLYLYEVLVQNKPYTENLARGLVILCGGIGTLVKLWNGQGRRRSLAFYEKAYREELGKAFQSKPALRKKLIGAYRLYNEDNYRKALKSLTQLLKAAESGADTCAVLLLIALCYTDADILQEAIKAYEKLLQVDPYHARGHSNLGLLYVKVGEFEKARQHYDSAVRYDSKNYYAYANRANYYFRMGEYDSAIPDAVRALEIKNNGVEASSLLAIIYALQGDEENKKKYYHLAISSGKHPEDLNAAIEYYLAENRNIPTEFIEE